MEMEKICEKIGYGMEKMETEKCMEKMTVHDNMIWG